MNQATLNKNLLASEAGEIVVYNFAADTREFLSRTTEYLAVGVGLPANACTDAPPAEKPGFAHCRNSDNSGWETVIDRRGETVYDTASGAPRQLTELGDYPAGTTTAAPASAWDRWNGSRWVLDEATQKNAQQAAAEKQKAQLLSAAKEHISLWQTQLQLDIISEEDKTALLGWMKYIQALQTVDTQTGADVLWPTQPA